MSRNDPHFAIVNQGQSLSFLVVAVVVGVLHVRTKHSSSTQAIRFRIVGTGSFDTGLQDSHTTDVSDTSFNDASMQDAHAVRDGGLVDAIVMDPPISSPTSVVDTSFESVDLSNRNEAPLGEAGWYLASTVTTHYQSGGIIKIGDLLDDPMDGSQTAYFGRLPGVSAGQSTSLVCRTGHLATAERSYEMRFYVGNPKTHLPPERCESSLVNNLSRVSHMNFPLPANGKVSEIVTTETPSAAHDDEGIRLRITCKATTDLIDEEKRLLVDHVRFTEL